MPKNINEQDVRKTLDSCTQEAKEKINNPDLLEQLLKETEQKLAIIPKVGEAFACIPTFILLLRSYIKKEYTDIPVGSLIAIVGALIYFVCPIDLIPDAIPILGYVDDATVLAFALKQVKSDVDNYNQWRNEQNQL